MLDTVYQPICIVCNKNPVSKVHNFCITCWKKIEFIAEPYCKRCGVPHAVEYLDYECRACYEENFHFDAVRSIVRYNELTKALIAGLKFHDKAPYAASFAHLIFRIAKPLINKSNMIIPVPMHSEHLRRRKYNQALLIARALARLAKKPLLPDSLHKVHQRKNQAGLTRSERLENLRGAFAVTKNAAAIQDKIILLVDDVMTTGATVNECARTLKAAGAAAVLVVTMARTY